MVTDKDITIDIDLPKMLTAVVPERAFEASIRGLLHATTAARVGATMFFRIESLRATARVVHPARINFLSRTRT